MTPPVSATNVFVRSTNASRPRSNLVLPSAASCFSMMFWVAMPGVVGAGKPKRFVARHPAPADDHVLHGVVETVPHVQHGRHVRRRDDHHERRARPAGARAPLGVRAVHARRVPRLVQAAFCRPGSNRSGSSASSCGVAMPKVNGRPKRCPIAADLSPRAGLRGGARARRAHAQQVFDLGDARCAARDRHRVRSVLGRRHRAAQYDRSRFVGVDLDGTLREDRVLFKRREHALVDVGRIVRFRRRGPRRRTRRTPRLPRPARRRRRRTSGRRP